jgi:opacity protein-like surface antigen
MVRMKRIIGLLCLAVLFGLPALAQEAPAPQDQDKDKPAPQGKPAPKEKPSPRERPKYDISVGYAYRSYYPPTSSRFGMNGLDLSVDYNIFRRWLAVAGEVTGTYGSQLIPVTPTPQPTDTVLVTFMVGPRVYPFGHNHKLTPYLHGLIGGGYVNEHLAASGGFGSHTMTSTAKAFALGGGLKWRFREKWDINLIQLDYESTYFFPGVGTNGGQRNFRATFGISYRWGHKN